MKNIARCINTFHQYATYWIKLTGKMQKLQNTYLIFALAVQINEVINKETKARIASEVHTHSKTY